MVSSPAVRVAAVLLLVLGVAVASVPAHPTPSVMEIRAGWKSRARASVASASPQAEEGYYEEKEVCLQEISRRDCSTMFVEVCHEDPDTGNDGGEEESPECWNPQAQWTSDVSCCQHNEGYSGYGHGSASVGDHLWGPHASIGSCDWMGDYSYSVETTSNINKWGSASAVCYFGADSQECGGPFCDRMVVTLQGAVYQVEKAYSYYTATNTNVDECADLDQNGILPRYTDDPVKELESFDPPARKAGQQKKPAQQRKPADAPKAAAPKQPAKPASSEAHTADASIQYNHYGHEEHHTNTVYEGEAWVINGAVTAIVGPKKDKWENGLFEYVIQYTTPGTAITSIDASIPWVKDKTYKFTFYKSEGYY